MIRGKRSDPCLQFVHIQSVIVECYGATPPNVLVIGGFCRGDRTTPRWPDMLVPASPEMPTTSAVDLALTSAAPRSSSTLQVSTTTALPPRTLLPGWSCFML